MRARRGFVIDQLRLGALGSLQFRALGSIALVLVAFGWLGAGTASAAGCGVDSPSGETGVSSWSELQSDVSAVASGSQQTFYLSTDISNTSGPYPYGQLQVATGASVTIDLNGCDLSVTDPGTVGDGAGAAAISVPAGAMPADGASLTIEDISSSVLADQGTLTADGGNANEGTAGGGAGIGGDGGDATVAVVSAGNVTVDGGTVDTRGGSSAISDEGGGGAGIGGGGGAGGGASAGGNGGIVTINGGLISDPSGGGGASLFGGGGAGIGGGGGGDDVGGYAAVGGNGGTVSIADGSVIGATGGGGGGAGGGDGAGIGGGGSGNSFGGSGGTLTLNDAALTDLTAAYDAAVTGGGGGASIEVQSGSNSLSGDMDGPFTVDQGATVSVASGQTLALYGYTATNQGTIDLAGQLTGSGALDNAGSITVSGDGWSADGQGPAPVSGPLIMGNAFDLQFSLTSGLGAPADEWVFAPTLASSGEVLPPIPSQPGFVSGSDWTAGGTQVAQDTSLAPLANSSGVISLSATETAIAPTITAALSSTLPEGSNGVWYAPVTVTFTCSTPSGTTLTCPAHVLLSTSGQGQTVSRTVTASNGASASVTTTGININLTRPSISYEITSPRPKSRWGWWSASVTVQFNCTTPSGTTLAGDCPAPIVVSTNGIREPSTNTITNSIGERASVTVPTISIDTTRPKLTIKGPRAGATYTRSAPKARCHATDRYSGIASCKLTTKKTKAGDGYHETITAQATNRAGTTRSIRVSFTIKR